MLVVQEMVALEPLTTAASAVTCSLAEGAGVGRGVAEGKGVAAGLGVAVGFAEGWGVAVGLAVGWPPESKQPRSRTATRMMARAFFMEDSRRNGLKKRVAKT